MDEKMEKAKTWFGEHKDKVASGMMQIGESLFIFGFGYVVGRKILEFKIDNGLAVAHHAGVIKFFDPKTGLETSIKNVPALLKELK